MRGASWDGNSATNKIEDEDEDESAVERFSHGL
jgi:hypothetical protein